MKRYVAGLMFSQDRKCIALIRKNYPDWQKGKLNGIGGKIEEKDYRKSTNFEEASINAMVREFKEESGVDTEVKDWNLFLEMSGNNTDENKTPFSVDFYRCFSNEVFNCKTITEEYISIIPVNDALYVYETIDNLKWIILLALDKNPKITKTIY